MRRVLALALAAAVLLGGLTLAPSSRATEAPLTPQIWVSFGWTNSSHAVGAPLWMNVSWNFAAYPGSQGPAYYTVSMCPNFIYYLPIASTSSRSANVTAHCLFAAGTPIPVYLNVVIEAWPPTNPQTVYYENTTLPAGTNGTLDYPATGPAPTAALGPLSVKVGCYVVATCSTQTAFHYANFSWSPIAASSNLLVYPATCAEAEHASAYGVPDVSNALNVSQSWMNLTYYDAKGRGTNLWVPTANEVYCGVVSSPAGNTSYVQFSTPFEDYAGSVIAGSGQCQNTCINAWGNATVLGAYSIPPPGADWGSLVFSPSYRGSPQQYDGAEYLDVYLGTSCSNEQTALSFSGTPSQISFPVLVFPGMDTHPSGGQAWSVELAANWSRSPSGFASPCYTVWLPPDPTAPSSSGSSGGFFGDPSNATSQTISVVVHYIDRVFGGTGSPVDYTLFLVLVGAGIGLGAGVARSKRRRR